ncbi:IQ domain-containing protein D-like [Copidosoma floridanum]|uniref:IQ domain-containing protein D-like n=1 Tax=Copidosoma floridanum TaxID=29053 RepID=UPI0006C99715|nr:IQ domain-containing protein D-like [Copidosoma floridanum]
MDKKCHSNFNKDSMESSNTYFQKPKVENVEIRIYLDRLVEIFTIIMTKLEFAVTLPSVLSHPRVMEILTYEDYKQVVLAFAPLLRCQNNPKEPVSPKSSTGAAEGSQDGSTSSRDETIHGKTTGCSEKPDGPPSPCFPKMNIDVYKAIEILSSYPLVRHVAERNLENLSKSALSFTRQLKYFMDFAVSQTKLTSLEERENELHLRRLFSEIERTQGIIGDLTGSLEEQKNRHQAESKRFLDRWNEYSGKWERINEELDAAHSKILKDSEETLEASREQFTVRMGELQAALRRAEDSLERQKAQNRKSEADVQGKKFKVESQLLGIITKYDTEIADRQAAYEELEMELADLEKVKAPLMEEMDKQLVIYNGIIAEREEREFAELREKLEKFVSNRYARIIQRWWRDILQKKKSLPVKKKKKGKKKK